MKARFDNLSEKGALCRLYNRKDHTSSTSSRIENLNYVRVSSVLENALWELRTYFLTHRSQGIQKSPTSVAPISSRGRNVPSYNIFRLEVPFTSNG